jgi:hypothetical protein
MALPLVMGLVGSQAQHVAASSEASTSDLYQSLYAPTDPAAWCNLGSETGYTWYYTGDNQPSGTYDMSPNCSPAQSSGTYMIHAWANDQQPNNQETTCTGVQGPAGDADTDPSGIALFCDYTDPTSENVFLNSNPGRVCQGGVREIDAILASFGSFRQLR